MDIPAHYLRRGQVRTIVDVFAGGRGYEVEFSDRSGQTFESLGVEPSKMMVLQYEPEAVAADHISTLTAGIEIAPWHPGN